MCPLLAQLIIGFFSFFGAAVYRTNEANKEGLKQSIFLDVYGLAPPSQTVGSKMRPPGKRNRPPPQNDNK
jgi:hypothetical protein